MAERSVVKLLPEDNKRLNELNKRWKKFGPKNKSYKLILLYNSAGIFEIIGNKDSRRYPENIIGKGYIIAEAFDDVDYYLYKREKDLLCSRNN